MNAQPLFDSVVAALAGARLEAVLIGNAAAAIQGAPVTTVDFDFMFRATPVNLAKLKKFAAKMDAIGVVSRGERRLRLAGGFHAGHSRREIIQQPAVARGKNEIRRKRNLDCESDGHHRQQTRRRAPTRPGRAGNSGKNFA